jgi:hypothetical protein
MQLLGPQDRPYARRLAAVGTRIRDGLWRDNKVVPAVLATLALIVFTWLVMGAFIGGSPDEEVANQVSLAQDEEARDGGREPEGGEAETPAPGVENRDTDSYSAFKSKDPFDNPLLKVGEGKAGDGKAGDTKTGGGSKTGDTKTGGGSKTGDTKTGGGNASANGRARDGGAPSDPSLRGTGQGGGAGDLFNSGGELPAP